MYVCRCTGIGEKRLEELIDDEGARSVRDVFRGHGARPQCGSCAVEIQQILKDRGDPDVTTADAIAKWKRPILSSGPQAPKPETPKDDPGTAKKSEGSAPPDLSGTPISPNCTANKKP